MGGAARGRRGQARPQVDLDRASAEAEVELLDPAARPDAGTAGGPSRARRAGRTARDGAAGRPGGRARAPAGASRTSRSLPRLLHATGSFATLRERLGPVGGAGDARPARRPDRGPARREVVPRGVARARRRRASGSAGSRATRRSATAWPRSWGRGWATRGSVAVLEPRTSLAYERSELVPDETAARVAALAAWRAGTRGCWWRQRPGAAPGDARARGPAGAAADVLEPGTRVGLDALLAELLERGYTPVLEVAGRGEFARRGGIVDVFPPSATLPVRIEFFGDEIDSLRAFDPTDQRSVGAVRELVAAAGDGVPAPAGRRGRDPGAARAGSARGCRSASRSTWRGSPGRRRPSGPRRRSRPDARCRPATPRRSGRGCVAPSTGLDHLDPSTLFVLDEPGDLADAADFLWRQAEERHARAGGAGRAAEGLAAGLPPVARLEGAAPRRADPRAHLAVRGGRGGGHGLRVEGPHVGRPVRLARARPAAGPDRAARRRRRALAGRAGARRARVATRRRASRSCSARPGTPSASSSRVAEAPPPGAIALVERSLNGGFEGGPDGLAVVTDRELFGSVRVRRPKAMRRVVPRDILERLTPGDMVVHIDHGIARYEQMLRRGGAGEERDYLELSFAAGDRIFVPVEQINRVSRYSAARTRSCRGSAAPTGCAPSSGSARRSTTSPRSCSSCTRSARRPRASRYAPDTPWQMEMEASFPYEETPDQLRAAVEVKVDMEARRPMDRLVVGDVGYGKTEVALRAAFKATQDGKQVAVLVPTTVLAGQHFTTFSQRFAAFPITVKLLSRFVGRRSRTTTVAGLARGGGRHRDRHAPAAVEGRGVPGPRPGGGRRGAAVRGRGEGAAQAAAVARWTC